MPKQTMMSTFILSAVLGSALALGHGCKKDKSGTGTGGGNAGDIARPPRR